MDVAKFRRKILSFYRKSGRDLPWRRTTNPYFILLSEVMLQQTQVDRVKEYYARWTRKWPTVSHLARADRKDVLREWMGLGYNNRAVNVHKAAQKMAKFYKGDVLKAVKNYEHVPGIGPYTSRAVRIFAANEDIATVDTNIRRILMHEFNLPSTVSDKKLWELAAQCLPKGRSRDWHNALMDYGSIVLTSRKTGIKPKTRQSTFEGSDRQIRAQVLRHVLRYGQTFAELQKVTGADRARLERIVGKMVAGGLIELKNRRYVLGV